MTDDTPTEFLEPPSDVMLDKAIGPYHLRSVLGEGGFGVVYLAEQSEPMRRRVALKLIKPGMDSQAVIARFKAEEQALAMMDHAGVARVFDAGVTDRGLPYFVMELVKGDPITGYCANNRLNLRARLHLFIQVCAAIQHAHTKGVIHRDIKPTNILVAVEGGQATPKVIDFGISKATNQPLTESPAFTQHGQMIGTPEYMSPEQAEMSGVDVDTRTDVYSLGVLLYELLTGALPFDSKHLRTGSLDEVRRLIRDVDPPRPSTRLGASEDAVSNERARARAIKGDLDWICLRAMEKDRTRRYETPSALARDIERHLANEPVEAGPPRATYRIGKFVRRNQTVVFAAATALLLLVGGLAGTSFGLFKAHQQSRLAEVRADETQRELQRAVEVTDFLKTMIEAVNPTVAQGRNTSLLRDMLDDAAARLDEGEITDPRTEADLRTTIGTTYYGLGIYDLAQPHLRRALQLRRDALGDDHVDTLVSINNMGTLLRDQGRSDDAEVYYRESLEGSRRILGDDDPATLTSINNLAVLLGGQGRLDDAEPYYREALERRRRVLGDDHPDTLTSINSMAFLLRGQGRLEEAEVLLREALQGSRRVLGDDHPNTLTAVTNLGFLLLGLERLDEAEPFFREALTGSQSVLGEDHPTTLIAMSNLALLLADLEQGTESLTLIDDAVERAARVLGEDHWLCGNFRGKRGRALQVLRQYAEAAAAMRQAYDILVTALGEEHEQTQRVIGYLVDLYTAWHATEPDAGHETTAATWDSRLTTPGG
ncbi:MAG: serine/threonine-protein kinase [Planctomycetota bacterium]